MEEIKEILYKRIFNNEDATIKFGNNFEKDLQLFLDIANIVDDKTYYKSNYYIDILKEIQLNYIFIIDKNISIISKIIETLEKEIDSYNYNLKIKGLLTCWYSSKYNTPSLDERLKVFDNLYSLKEKILYVDLSFYPKNENENKIKSISYFVSEDRNLQTKNIISIDTFIRNIEELKREFLHA